METIFISIASCKEEFLVQTIKSAIENAKNPELLYFGIANMVVDQIDFLDDPIFDSPNINYVETKHAEPLGTGFGRMVSSLMIDREHTYYLQVDAHTLFEKYWDESVKRYYELLLSVCEKPIITTCPAKWELGPNREVLLHYDNKTEEVDPYNFKTDVQNSSLKIKVKNQMNPKKPDEFMKYAYVDWMKYKWEQNELFHEHSLIFAAFVFTDFKYVREILHDPSNPWDGDQTNMSFRAGTRGYRMFAVRDCFIWSKDRSITMFDKPRYNWRNVRSKRVKNFYYPYSSEFQAKMFSGEYLGYWGAPDKQSIVEYSQRLGIDLSEYFILCLKLQVD
jgi:hypothetical protein